MLWIVFRSTTVKCIASKGSGSSPAPCAITRVMMWTTWRGTSTRSTILMLGESTGTLDSFCNCSASSSSCFRCDQCEFQSEQKTLLLQHRYSAHEGLTISAGVSCNFFCFGIDCGFNLNPTGGGWYARSQDNVIQRQQWWWVLISIVRRTETRANWFGCTKLSTQYFPLKCNKIWNFLYS